MYRVNYDLRNITVGATTYKLYIPTLDNSADYLEFDADALYVPTGGTLVYAKVVNSEGEITTLLESGTPSEGSTKDALKLIYHGTNWYILIGG